MKDFVLRNHQATNKLEPLQSYQAKLVLDIFLESFCLNLIIN